MHICLTSFYLNAFFGLKDIDKRIEKLLEESDRIDKEEQENGSLVKTKEKLIDQKKLREQIKGILAEFKTKGELNKDKVERTSEYSAAETAGYSLVLTH